MKTKSVSDLLLEEIERWGTKVIFLVPGANIYPFIKRLIERNTFNIIIANHELAAGFMAIGYALASGKPGVVCTIGSPGVAYLTGAGMSARADNIPLLCISGNIPENQWGQGLFQDGSPQGSNDSAIFNEATGQSLICHQAQQISSLLAEIRTRLSESKPVHIQLPINIQNSLCNQIIEHTALSKRTLNKLHLSSFTMDQPVKIGLLIGHKAKNILNSELLKAFVKQQGIGVITDIKSRGITDESSMESLGYIGFNSSRKAVVALDVKSTLAIDHLYIIGVDEVLLKRYVSTEMKTTHIEAHTFQSYLENQVTNKHSQYSNVRFQWLTSLKQIISYHSRNIHYADKLSYADLLSSCAGILPKESIYCLDSGQIRRAGNLMLQAHALDSIIQSDTLSPMGVGICAAIGVKKAKPGATVIALFGDGSMRMHGMELVTAKRYNLAIIFILCDNESYASTPGNNELKKLPKIRWNEFAASLDIKSFYIDNKADFNQHLTRALNCVEPVLLWVKVPDLLDEENDIIPLKADETWLSEFQK